MVQVCSRLFKYIQVQCLRRQFATLVVMHGLCSDCVLEGATQSDSTPVPSEVHLAVMQSLNFCPQSYHMVVIHFIHVL